MNYLNKKQNESIRRGLSNAVNAVNGLNRLGCSVIGVEMGNKRPVIRIEPPRPSIVPDGIEPICIKGCDAVREHILAVTYEGCLVKWSAQC